MTAVRTHTLAALASSTLLALAACGDLSTDYPGKSDEVDEVTVDSGGAPAKKKADKPKKKTVTTDISGDGTWLVGADIKPGVYVAPDPADCYWERLSGLSGDFNDMIANDNVTGQAVVEVKKKDKALSTNRCGGWVKAAKIPRAPRKKIQDGTWLVGKQIKPGTYRTTSASDCYWERVSGFGGDFNDMIANDNVNGQAVVQIKRTDAGFTSNRCGTWQRIGG